MYNSTSYTFHNYGFLCLTVFSIGVVLFKQLVFGKVWKNSCTLSMMLNRFLFIICLSIVSFT